MACAFTCEQSTEGKLSINREPGQPCGIRAAIIACPALPCQALLQLSGQGGAARSLPSRSQSWSCPWSSALGPVLPLPLRVLLFLCGSDHSRCLPSGIWDLGSSFSEAALQRALGLTRASAPLVYFAFCPLLEEAAVSVSLLMSPPCGFVAVCSHEVNESRAESDLSPSFLPEVVLGEWQLG